MGTLFDPHFLWLTVHDLRNPLNVIKLTLRMVQDSTPNGNDLLAEDLRIIHDHVVELERMLTLLSDYGRLTAPNAHAEAVPFDPRRFVGDVVEDFGSQASVGSSPVRLDIAAQCPEHVELDPKQAKLALQCALHNANASAEGAPVRVGLGGNPDRLRITITIERPPRDTVHPALLRSHSFERLAGNPAERLSLELALVARVCELFGGMARLDVAEGRDSTLVIEWPTRLS